MEQSGSAELERPVQCAEPEMCIRDRRIAEQTEHIEKLNEADNVLKLNAELKKQNEKLKQDKLNAEQEAEATVSSVKREYDCLLYTSRCV